VLLLPIVGCGQLTAEFTISVVTVPQNPIPTRPVPPRKLFRTSLRGAALIWVVIGSLAESALLTAAGQMTVTRKAKVLQKWCRRIILWSGIKVTVEGVPPATGLIVSNHLSYMDIMVFSTVTPCAFVSKREVFSWPGVGWVAALTGNIFIDRARTSETHAIQPRIQQALDAGGRLVLFPEGTSSNGDDVLRFHSSLFQPAIMSGAAVTPAHISYTVADGDARTDVCYWGNMVLAPHLWNLLSKDAVEARVRFSDQAFKFTDRKQAALQMRECVQKLGRDAAVAAV